MPTKKKPLPAGEYTTQIMSVKEGMKPNQLVLTLKIQDNPFAIPKGYQRFIVWHDEKKMYTTLACKNIHHAGNKATKELKGNFSGLMEGNYPRYANFKRMGYQFVTVAKFNQLLKD